MRTVYREKIRNLSHDMILMCDQINHMIRAATQALVHNDLEKAQDVKRSAVDLEQLRISCENTSFELLAREAPVARDLRQVVSGIYICQDLARMGALSSHIAGIALRAQPQAAIDETMAPYFEEIGRLCDEMTQSTHEVLVSRDADRAVQMGRDDQAIDDIYESINRIISSGDRELGHRQIVSMTLLSRYYERFGDHCVSVGARMVYMATGYKLEEYLDMRDLDEKERVLQARFRNIASTFDD
ncbi:phosphate signaling complex protein PhoU [Corynebacterium sp. ES2775-CONJ]|uniref:phosphate signaling complex protein PhoU n=1 Tax=Corynebacterium sp. ES2775-CONJ TaxID=2974029 RepID=UPI002169DE31|nr:phosphate signaling complex protein PhoU [Corynebacterium sp. ES2775-CONJ]MCS4489916.1 phosphate signaling complex protein PhoU [Corynebacterium sp. ES2775-CONJ]